VFRQKLLGDDGSVGQGVVMVNQSGLFSPKFGASSHACTQSSKNFAGNSQFGLLGPVLRANTTAVQMATQCGILWIPSRITVRSQVTTKLGSVRNFSNVLTHETWL
jgi:hypothetical protein